MAARDDILKLGKRIGQEAIVKRMLVPTKTSIINRLSKNIDVEFSRIQFTPDLITGSEIYFSEGGTRRLLQ
jgi:MoxR-like ATPase